MSVDLQPTLKSELLVLCPLKEEDRAGLFRVASDPLIWEQHPQHDRWRPDIFDIYFNTSIQSRCALVVLDAKSGGIIGCSRYYDWKPEEKSITIGGTFLARDYWRKGYNREMKKLMLEHAFQFADEVLFEVGTMNKRSQEAMEGIGGVKIAERPGLLADGSPMMSVVYQITKERGMK